MVEDLMICVKLDNISSVLFLFRQIPIEFIVEVFMRNQNFCSPSTESNDKSANVMLKKCSNVPTVGLRIKERN